MNIHRVKGGSFKVRLADKTKEDKARHEAYFAQLAPKENTLYECPFDALSFDAEDPNGEFLDMVELEGQDGVISGYQYHTADGTLIFVFGGEEE